MREAQMAESLQTHEVRSRRRPTRYSPEPLHNETTNDAILLSELQQQECIRLAAQAEHNYINGYNQQQNQHVNFNGNVDNNETLANMPTLVPVNNTTTGRRSSTRTKQPKRRYTRKKANSSVNSSSNNVNGNGTTSTPNTEVANKRHRVANVLLENEILIDEIRERKAIWMRTHDQHHSNSLTAPLWEEIAKILDSTPESLKKRWKSLKDHYRREMKKSMNDPTAPASQWPYYKKMRFMKTQMFVSLRRKNDGEEHMEILSSEGEETETQWNNNVPRKRELEGNETVEDYDLSQEYRQLVKYEQHMQQLSQESERQEMEQEENETQEQEQTQEEQEDQEMSPNVAMQEDELEQHQNQLHQSQLHQSQLHQTQLHQTQLHQNQLHQTQIHQTQLHQNQLHQTQLQDQNTISNNIPTMTNSTMADLVGIPTIVTTTATSLSERLTAMQQEQDPIENENEDMNEELAEMAVRQSAIQHQQEQINDRLSNIHRTTELSAMQERANIEALHRRAEMSAMQQRARMEAMRRRSENNETGENGVGSSNIVSPIIGDERGGISDDYHFFMSLMPHVRHFSSLQKLRVRSRIQQVIIEEASNCQNYDPLANC